MSSPTTEAKKAPVLLHRQARYGSTAHKTTLFLEPPLSRQASKNAPPRNRPHLTKESRADRPGKGEKGSVQEGGILWTQPATTPALGLLEVTTTRVSADQYSLVEEDEVEEEQQPAIIMAETLPLLPWCICCAMVCCCRSCLLQKKDKRKARQQDGKKKRKKKRKRAMRGGRK